MSAELAALVISIVILCIGALIGLVIFFGWGLMTLVLLGLLGWHPPGWLISPGAHIGNTLVLTILELVTAIGTVAGIVATFALLA